MKVLAGAVASLAVLVLTGCGNVAINHVPHQSEPAPRKLAVFFDGTANDEASHTNVAKLHNLVTLQSKQNISTSYIKGVGVDGKVIGMATGWGIGQDVRQAYRYLAENYRPCDEIYLFGFSRGAFAARILAALVHVVGIADLSEIKGETVRIEYVRAICAAFESDAARPIADRRTDVQEVLVKLGLVAEPARIKFMGLWDTVEALGLPDYEENIDVPNPRYADQLCNIDKAAHAVSLDDNRARIFTPILLTRPHLIEICKDEEIKIRVADGGKRGTKGERDKADKEKAERIIDGIVTEVWFSGAHADVGGGYRDTQLSGVSLNWMIAQIREADGLATAKENGACRRGPGLLPEDAEVYSDFAGRSHNPEGGFFSLIYHDQRRDIAAYMSNDVKKASGDPDKRQNTDAGPTENGRKMKIHQSVVDRLEVCRVEQHESQWFVTGKYENACAKKEGNKIEFDWASSSCQKYVEVVDTEYRKCPSPGCDLAGDQKKGELASDKRKKGPESDQSCRWITDLVPETDAAQSAAVEKAAGS